MVTSDLSLPKANFLNNPKKVVTGISAKWIGESWPIVKPDIKTWILITLALFAWIFALGLIPYIGAAILSLFAPIMFGGLLLGIHRSATENIPLKLQTLWMGFDDKWLGLITLGAVSLFLSVISDWAFDYIEKDYLGLNLTGEVKVQDTIAYLIFTMIYVLVNTLITLAFYFAIPLVMFNDISAVDALKASLKGGLVNILPLFVYSLLISLLIILGILSLLLGLFISIPLLQVSTYLAYKDIYV
ncbi:BPSS1780 family membrane protein [Thiofilum flexile]|uniref:BPSS1780 family membrane protein n=1 Tax=Thiofilum flexile TaxID=125627 RepID=UPI000372C32C|nr:BPSS1780 family membrane protein [Thiofilum flexile]